MGVIFLWLYFCDIKDKYFFSVCSGKTCILLVISTQSYAERYIDTDFFCSGIEGDPTTPFQLGMEPSPF